MKHINIMKKIVKITILLGTVLTLLGISSCNNGLTNSNLESGLKDKCRIYIDVSDISYERSVSTINPDVQAYKALLTNLELKGSKTSSGTKTRLAGDCDDENSTLATISSEPILLDSGLWYFSLTAKLGEVVFSCDLSMSLTAGSTSSIPFKLTTSNNSANTINITVTFNDKDAPDSEITKVVATLKSSDKTTTHASDEITSFEAAGTGYRKLTYNKTSLDGSNPIAAGTYYLDFEFFAGDSTHGFLSLNKLPAYVRVADGLTTAANISIELNEVYTITYNDSNTTPGTLADGQIQPLKFSSKKAVTLPVLKHDTDYFAGWCLNSDFSDEPKMSLPKGTNADTPLYAKWIKYSVGDVLLNDGSFVPYGEITSEQVNSVVGVVYCLDQNNAPMGVIGLKEGEGSWAADGTTGQKTKFEPIVCTPSNSNPTTATFTGDTDGSDNWAYICSIDPEGTANAATNYPVFNSVNNYATSVGLTGDYAKGWYIPSLAELCAIFKNKGTISNAFNAIISHGTNTADVLRGGNYWSSSQVDISGYLAWYVDFGDSGDIKSSNTKEFDLTWVRYVRSAKPVQACSVIFDTNGGSAVTTQKITTGQTAQEPSGSDIPTKEGYTFGGWYNNKALTTPFDFDTPITEHTVLFARWILAPGALLLTDGTYIPYSSSPSFTSQQVQNAVGIVYDVDQTTGEPRGVIGLKNATKVWAPENTTGNDTVFEDIVVRTSLTMPDEGIPYFVYDWSHFGVTEPKYATGDLDGSDNWAYVRSADPIGAADAATNYPAFDYVNNYGTVTATNLTGTDYENGWYMPSIVELWYVFNNKDILNNVISALNTAQSGSADVLPDAYRDNFISSSQNSQAPYVYHINFGADSGGDFIGGFKNDTDGLICCVRTTKALPDYAVVFNTNSGSAVASQKVTSGQKATEPTDSNIPTKEGYTFDGWYTDSSLTTAFDFDTAITDHTVLFAKWDRPIAVGDLLLNDGTVVPYIAETPFTTTQIQNAVGIVCELDNGAPKTVMGLKQNTSKVWAPQTSNGYNTKFDHILCTITEDFSATDQSTTHYVYNIQNMSGDESGNDNWEKICTEDLSASTNAETNYPAFYYANTYGTTAGLTGAYATGWFIPSLAELRAIYNNYAKLSQVVSAINNVQSNAADAFSKFQYWTSSQAADGNYNFYAWSVSLNSGQLMKESKFNSENVLCIHTID